MTISVKNEHLCLSAELIMLSFQSNTMIIMVNNLYRKDAMNKFEIGNVLKVRVEWSEARDFLMVYYLNFAAICSDNGVYCITKVMS